MNICIISLTGHTQLELAILARRELVARLLAPVGGMFHKYVRLPICCPQPWAVYPGPRISGLEGIYYIGSSPATSPLRSELGAALVTRQQEPEIHNYANTLRVYVCRPACGWVSEQRLSHFVAAVEKDDPDTAVSVVPLPPAMNPLWNSLETPRTALNDGSLRLPFAASDVLLNDAAKDSNSFLRSQDLERVWVDDGALYAVSSRCWKQVYECGMPDNVLAVESPEGEDHAGYLNQLPHVFMDPQTGFDAAALEKIMEVWAK